MSTGHETGRRPVGSADPLNTSATAWPASTPRNHVASTAPACSKSQGTMSGLPELSRTTVGLPSRENGLGQRPLAAGQVRPGPARRLAAHEALLAEAEEDDVGLARRLDGRLDAALVRSLDGRRRARGRAPCSRRRRAGHRGMLTASSGAPAADQGPGISRPASASGPKDGYSLGRGIQREEPRPVLEQHDRAAARLAGQRPALGLRRRGGRRSAAAAVGIVEKAQPLLQREHAPNRFVDPLDADEAALERLGQATNERVAHHVDVDAGLEGERRGLGQIGRHAVRDQLRHGAIVADEDAAEAPAAAQQGPEKRRVGRRRHAREVVEGRHHRGCAMSHGGREGRQMHLVQRALGDVDRGIFAACADRPIAAQMLGAGGHGVRGVEAAPLQGADPGLGQPRREPGILARALRDAPPAGIAADIQHRREEKVEAVGRGLLGGDAGGPPP